LIIHPKERIFVFNQQNYSIIFQCLKSWVALIPAIKEEKNGVAQHFLIDNSPPFSIITTLATSNFRLEGGDDN